MSNKEIVQIYDDYGNPTVSLGLQEAIDKNLRRGVARVFVIDENGLVCIQKRSLAMEIAPGLYDQSAGGHIDAGEDPKSAALRELSEELGIQAHDLEYVEAYPFEEPFDGGMRHSYDFLYVARAENDFSSMQREEVSEVRWLSISDLEKEYDTYPEKFAPSLAGSLHRFVAYSKLTD